MAKDRIEQIYNLLQQDGEVLVNDLVNILNASPATVRRDLQKMEDMKLVNRFYGGAKINTDIQLEPTMNAKHLVNMTDKDAIAKYAATLIKENDVVYLDAGTTTEKMVNYIYCKNIIVVTQALSIIAKLYEKQIRCYTLGGYLKFSTNIIVDSDTVERINNLDFDIAFIGTNGIHSNLGYTTTNEIEAMLKHAAINRAKKAYILADSSKFNTISNIKFANISDVAVITDKINEEVKESFKTEIIEIEK